MNKNVAVLLSAVLACLAVAFVVLAVVTEAGRGWIWVAFAAMSVAVAAALLRVGTLRDAR